MMEEHFYRQNRKKYDVIMVDAYQDITSPFQMSSVEFFTMVKEHLTEKGVMVVNMNMRGTGEGNINEYLSDTISSVLEPYRSAAENVNVSSGRKVRRGTFVLYGQRRVNMV